MAYRSEIIALECMFMVEIDVVSRRFFPDSWFDLDNPVIPCLIC